MNSCEKMGVNQALKHFGGFVRYYDTTEPLPKLARLVSAGHCRNILACCGGGNQALTMLGAGGGRGSLWAIDINPAQLFVLAAKSLFLKQNNNLPSFEQIEKAYPGRIAAVKKNIGRLHQKSLYHRVTGQVMALPVGLSEKYGLVIDEEMFVLKGSGPYWQKDRLFTSRVIAGLGRLQFARMDIFDSPDHFEKGSLDLIYLSDIFWPQALAYYQVKLARLAGLLRPGGQIIISIDGGDDFMGQGISPGRMLLQLAGKLALKIGSDYPDSGYLVLERMRERR